MAAIVCPPIPEPGSFLVMENVSWEDYETIRDETDAEGSHVRISYDNGKLVLMSPLPRHERFKTRIGRMIEMATWVWNIPIYSLGSTTWKRRDVRKALEADECYYIQHESAVRGRDDLNLKRDPPPDLAVEIDITQSSKERHAIYAGLGIGEIWRYDGRKVDFLKLGTDGNYHAFTRSEALPCLTPADIDRFLPMFLKMDENSVLRAFRDWVREVA